MIDDNIRLILGLFLKNLLRFCDLRPGNTGPSIVLGEGGEGSADPLIVAPFIGAA